MPAALSLRGIAADLQFHFGQRMDAGQRHLAAPPGEAQHAHRKDHQRQQEVGHEASQSFHGALRTSARFQVLPRKPEQ